MRQQVSVFILLFLFSGTGAAQNYPIGHRTITYNDPERNNRPVPPELYYPALTAGNKLPPATGIFPVIVFGYGYLFVKN